MFPRRLHKFKVAGMVEMMMKTKQWRMLKVMEIPQTNTKAEVAVLDLVLQVEISEKRELVPEKEEQMADERRSISLHDTHCLSIYDKAFDENWSERIVHVLLERNGVKN